MMLSWLPADVLESMGVGNFKMIELQRPNGEVFERRCGAVIVTIQGRSTIDDVVFAEPTDPICIGWRTLSGLNLCFDPTSGQLVDGGPIPAAAFSSSGVSLVGHHE
jgi:predicted aspartyl protease